MKSCLLTGLNGFIAQHLAVYLIERGYEVEGLVRKGRGLDPEVSGKVSRIYEVTDYANEFPVFLENKTYNHVIHLASAGTYPGVASDEEIIEFNLNVTKKVYQAAKSHQVKSFVFFGSQSEYGSNCFSADEKTCCAPNTVYGWSKLAASTWLLMQNSIIENPTTSVIRPFSVFGRLDDKRHLIPRLVKLSMEGKLPPLSDPQTSRDFISVKDVCNLVFEVIKHHELGRKGDLFNACSGFETTLLEVVEIVCRLTGNYSVPQWGAIEKRSFDRNSCFGVAINSSEILGWKPTVPLIAGLQELVELERIWRFENA